VAEIKGVRPLCWALWGNRTRGRRRGRGIVRRLHRRGAVWAWIGSAIKKTTNPIQAPDRSKRPDRFDFSISTNLAETVSKRVHPLSLNAHNSFSFLIARKPLSKLVAEFSWLLR
jgi:hypothetical protein